MNELDDETFGSYGLDEAAIRQLAGWALAWEADIRSRLASGDTGPVGVPDDDEWDAYLDPA